MEILPRHGRTVSEFAEDPRVYAGVGERTSTGSRRFPMGMKGTNGLRVVATLRSQELPNDEDPYILISLNLQKKMNMIKDVASGTCYLKQYQTYVQMYEVEDSGLRCVCITDYLPMGEEFDIKTCVEYLPDSYASTVRM